MKPIITTSLTTLLLLATIHLHAQTFPPPRNLTGIAPDDAVILYWQPPEDAAPSYYKVYKNGLFNRGVFLPF
jgi:hypothetical protein